MQVDIDPHLVEQCRQEPTCIVVCENDKPVGVVWGVDTDAIKNAREKDSRVREAIDVWFLSCVETSTVPTK